MFGRGPRFIAQADGILEQLEQELDPDNPMRNEEIAASDIEAAIAEITKMKTEVEHGPITKKSMRYPHLTRMIVDQWPLGSELGNAISELEQFYIHL